MLKAADNRTLAVRWNDEEIVCVPINDIFPEKRGKAREVEP